MKKSLIKLLSSTIALTLVLASSGMGATQIDKIKTEDIKADNAVAVVQEVKEEKNENSIIEVIEEKMKEQAPVVEIVKTEAPASEAEEIAVPAEEISIPEIKAEPTEENVIPEAPKAEPDEVWNISAEASDAVAMAFYAEPTADENQIAVDRQSGVVYISGTGAMEENVYRHFMSIEKYLIAEKALFEAEYGVEVRLEYDETITDVLELDKNIFCYSVETGERLVVTEHMRENLNPAEFLEYSPRAIYVNEGITNISDNAFLCCADLKEVKLPSTIKSVGVGAFGFCGNLKKVILPESAEIKEGAFAYCYKLESVQLASEAYYSYGISANSEDNSIDNANATWNISATDSDNVSMTFYADEASYVEVDRKSGVVYINGTGAMEQTIYRHFMSTAKYLAAMEKLFETEYGVQVDLVYDETITDVLELDLNVRYYAHETKEELFVTDKMCNDINPIEFLEYSPKAIYVSEGITNVSDFAFVFCADLEEVVLPSTVETVGEGAFQYCENLRRVVVPANAEIKAEAFSYCDKLTTIERADEAFYNNGVATEDNANVRNLTAEEINVLINEG